MHSLLDRWLFGEYFTENSSLTFLHPLYLGQTHIKVYMSIYILLSKATVILLSGSKPKNANQKNPHWISARRQFFHYYDVKLATNLLVKPHQIQFHLWKINAVIWKGLLFFSLTSVWNWVYWVCALTEKRVLNCMRYVHNSTWLIEVINL